MPGIETGCFAPENTFSGMTFGYWTAEWWRWAMKIPKVNNPVLDLTGRYAEVEQPRNVWFLAGIFAQEIQNFNTPCRSCSIPNSSPILIPILNCAADTIHSPELNGPQDLLEKLSEQTRTVGKLECSLDNRSIIPQRVRSDPLIFDLYVHPDHDETHKGGYGKAAADGYWVFLKPLPLGEHILRFSGTYENGRLWSGATYRVTIVNLTTVR